MLYDNDTFERKGHSFKVTFQHDDDSDAPWDREDGHGPVSKWTMRAKEPGELVLCSDRNSRRLYNFAEACKIARRDGWGPRDIAFVGTAKQKAAQAALEDYNRMRQWCNDLWSYVGVVVTLLDEDGDETEKSESLWGVESDGEAFLKETAHELADQIISELTSLEAVTELGEPVL